MVNAAADGDGTGTGTGGAAAAAAATSRVALGGSDDYGRRRGEHGHGRVVREEGVAVRGEAVGHELGGGRERGRDVEVVEGRGRIGCGHDDCLGPRA